MKTAHMTKKFIIPHMTVSREDLAIMWDDEERASKVSDEEMQELAEELSNYALNEFAENLQQAWTFKLADKVAQ